MNPEEGEETRQNLPSSASELGSRLVRVADLYPSRKDAARMANVSYEQLNRYLRGKSVPPVDVAGRLCHGVRVSLDWLVSGEGPMFTDNAAVPASPAALNEELLEACLRGLEMHLAERRLTLPPAKKATVVSLLYLEVLEREQEPRHTDKSEGEGLTDLIGRFVRLAS